MFPTDPCMRCGGTLIDCVTVDGKAEFKCARCGQVYVPEPRASTENKDNPYPLGARKMRSEHDIRSMVDYLAARDPHHADLGIMRWVLGDPDAGKDQRLAELEKASAHQQEMFKEALLERDAHIEDLKKKLERFVSPATRVNQ